MSPFDAFTGGLGAALGPEMVVVAGALSCGAVVAGSRDASVRAAAVLALVFALGVTAVWTRADLIPPARFSHWLALVPLLGLAEIRRLRLGWEDWMAPAIALCTAGLVLFWRIDRYGPVLARLRGDWQEPLSLFPRAAYHLGTAVALGALLFALILGIRRLPPGWRLPLAWTVIAAGIAVAAFDLVAPAQSWLLLHGPPLRTG